MDKILTDFGVQPVYLAAQAVNFILLLFILKKFMYKPILKVIEERKKIASKTLHDAEKIEVQLKNTDLESAEKLDEASKKAQIILKKASHAANQIVAEAHEKAESDVENMLQKGKESISQDREIMKNELREELADLVILGVERIAGKILDEADQNKILTQTINDLKTHSH